MYVIVDCTFTIRSPHDSADEFDPEREFQTGLNMQAYERFEVQPATLMDRISNTPTELMQIWLYRSPIPIDTPPYAKDIPGVLLTVTLESYRRFLNDVECLGLPPGPPPEYGDDCGLPKSSDAGE